MTQVQEIYTSFVEGMDLPPTPTDPMVGKVWQAFTEVVNLVGLRLYDEWFGAHTNAADEVRLQLERHNRVARTVEGMKVHVPQSATRAISTLGHYLENTSDIEELQGFLELNVGIADTFSEYLRKHLGRVALPALYSLHITAKSAGLMSDCVKHELAPLTYKGW